MIEKCMKKKLKDIPKFKTEEEEREFWATHDSTDYLDWDKAERVIFPNLKPTTPSISLRLPNSINLWTDTYRRCHPNTERFNDSQFKSWPGLENSSVEISGTTFENQGRVDNDLIKGLDSPDGFEITDEKAIGEQNKEEARNSIKKDGMDAIAFYAPVHFFGEINWGIYIHERRFFGLCSAIVDEIGQNEANWDDVLSDVYKALMRHEYFHAGVELFCLVFEDFTGPFAAQVCAYTSYFDDIYTKTYPNVDCSEESLATAAEFLCKYRSPGLKSALTEITKTMPPGYANGLEFRRRVEFREGVQQMAFNLRRNAESIGTITAVCENSDDENQPNIYASLRMAQMRFPGASIGSVWFPSTTPRSLNKCGTVPRWIYRSGGITSSRTLKKSKRTLKMREFLRTLMREYNATLDGGGKELKIRFPNGKKVSYSKSAIEVKEYLVKEIADILSISKAELRQRCG